MSTHEGDEDLLYQVLRILDRDLIVAQDGFHPRLQIHEHSLDDLLEFLD